MKKWKYLRIINFLILLFVYSYDENKKIQCKNINMNTFHYFNQPLLNNTNVQLYSTWNYIYLNDLCNKEVHNYNPYINMKPMWAFQC